jgi:Family of unknown function (DUF6278)
MTRPAPDPARARLLRSLRARLPGPKHGTARSVAAYSAKGGADPRVLAGLLARCEQLRSFALAQGLHLADDPESLSLLDQRLDQWSADPETGRLLGNDLGLYFGSVLVTNVPGAR